MLCAHWNISFELEALIACKCLVAVEVGELLLWVSSDDTETLLELHNSSQLKAYSLHCFSYFNALCNYNKLCTMVI